VISPAKLRLPIIICWLSLARDILDASEEKKDKKNMSYAPLLALLSSELDEIDRTAKICVDRSRKRAQFAASEAEDILADSLAACLHSFYSGLENLFQAIALELDEGLPKGEKWHKRLLTQMSVEIPRVRPAVISRRSFDYLEAFRAFRHLFRNLYTHNLAPERVFALAASISDAWQPVLNDLRAFLRFLEELDAGKDSTKL